MPSRPQRADPSLDVPPPRPARLAAVGGREMREVIALAPETQERRSGRGSAGGRPHPARLHPPHRLPSAGASGSAASAAVPAIAPAAGAVELPLRPRLLSPDDDAPPIAPPWRLGVKRGVDVVGAIIGLVLSIPVLLVLAVLIRLESPGAVIFAQPRVGRDGRLFRCYKLRTMRRDAEALLQEDTNLRAMYEANAFKLPAHFDRRITPLGRLLRETSLDELPQFWNVLRGDMSLVGPRPIVENELVHYEGTQRTLLSVRPGLTGAWAVRGRSRIGYPERSDIELDYVHEWTLGGDLAILARTVVAVLQRRGAY